MHTCRMVQMVQMKQLPGKKGRCRHREWDCGHGRGSREGMDSESSSGIDTLPCVKQASRGKLRSTGSLVRVECGGGREVKREGIYAYLWMIHIHTAVQQKLTQYRKVIIFQ